MIYSTISPLIGVYFTFSYLPLWISVQSVVYIVVVYTARCSKLPCNIYLHTEDFIYLI